MSWPGASGNQQAAGALDDGEVGVGGEPRVRGGDALEVDEACLRRAAATSGEAGR